MYTSATINPQMKAPIHSSKRLYLTHKTQHSTIENTLPQPTQATETVEATIYFTNVPLDGKQDSHIAIAHRIATHATSAITNAVSNIVINTKVRERDLTIISTLRYEQAIDDNDDIVYKEKAIWEPLKMTTLIALLQEPEVGPYLPLSDTQLSQLNTYLTAKP